MVRSGLIFLFVVQGIARAAVGRLPGSALTSTIAGFLVWVIAGSIVVAMIIAVLAFLFSLFAGNLPAGRGSGWSGGSGGGWSSGGAGGFSGGGGGSGGGGASGSW